MTSVLVGPSVALRGSQRPQICHVPPFAASSGAEAIELAAMAGLYVDPWQEYLTEVTLGERPDGKWAAFEVGVEVSRQNGKGSFLEVRALAGLYILGERFITWSAHQFDTSLEAFRRLLFLIENCDDLRRRVKRVSKSHGEEGIELLSGQRIRFRTRTKGGGRGFTSDLVILDEAMEIAETAHGALFPTLSARPNPQVIYAGSAVDQTIHEHGVVFARVRKRGRAGDDPRLAWLEWTAGEDLADADGLATDPAAWARANPGLGIRISLEHVAAEQRSMDARTFAVERLGIGDWPEPDGDDGSVISVRSWTELTDKASEPAGPVSFAFDVRPNRSAAAIGVAGARLDGLRHVEVVDHRKGTGWVADRLVELVAAHKCGPVRFDPASPAASLVTQLADLGVPLEPVPAKGHAEACGMLFDAVEQRTVRHLGTQELVTAIRGVVKRRLGDAWAWSRTSSTVDISPLVACTLALRGFEADVTAPPARRPFAAII